MSGTTGTPRTQSYLLSTEFQDGQQAGAIDPQDIRDFIVTTGSYAQGSVTPEMYGALGNGIHDDAAALNAAAAAAIAANVPLVLGAKIYAVGSQWVITSDGSGTEQNTPASIRGIGQVSTIIRALPGATSPLVKLQNAYGMYVGQFMIDGAGHVNTCFDTTWNVGFGPSIQMKYDQIQVRNYNGTGWVAQSNNDCAFHNVTCDAGTGTGTIGLDIDATGGNVTLLESFFANPVRYGAQKIDIINCVVKGLIANYADYNSATLVGGYYYADPSTGICFAASSGFSAQPFQMFGVRAENGTTNGSFFGGVGAIPSIQGYGGQFVNATSGGNQALTILAAGLNTGLSVQGTARFVGTWFGAAITQGNTSWYLTGIDLWDDSNFTPWQTDEWRVGRQDYTGVLSSGILSVSQSWGKLGHVFNGTVAASSGSHGVLSGIPPNGRIIIVCQSGGAPATTFNYFGGTQDTAFSIPDGGAHTVAGTIGFGTDWQVTITPTNTSTAQYLVTVFGLG